MTATHTHEGRGCVVITPAPDKPRAKALIRYVDGHREILLVEPASLDEIPCLAASA